MVIRTRPLEVLIIGDYVRGLSDRDAAEQFELAAAAARKQGDDAKVVVGLRNAADERRLDHNYTTAEQLLDEALATNLNRAVEIDIAKAKVVFAVLRFRQGRRDEAWRFLDEAEETFQCRLVELEPGDSEWLREHLQTQLRQLASVREKTCRLRRRRLVNCRVRLGGLIRESRVPC